ncbi:PQ-loop-domain-containing protein [Neoconidiobolus thromboides FSU 785]|nr:PQ-loop-domain-containing protein [Neoconidiobolus thromboides FSU 785]
MSLLTTISWCFGWIYFSAWSISFYPQAILNYKRKSVQGLSFDFLYYNVLGFFCYTVYNFTFMFSEIVKKQYQERYGPNENLVKLNDLFFSTHALILSSLTLYQTFIYKRDEEQKLSIFGTRTLQILLSIMGISFLISLFGGIKWLDMLYVFSFIKLILSLVKYIPQAYLNYKRKSTIGWSIHNILLDFTGGLFSIAQLLIDSSLQNDWSGILGNPIKFFLGNLSILFDLLFMYQHYILYPHTDEEELEEGYQALT